MISHFGKPLLSLCVIVGIAMASVPGSAWSQDNKPLDPYWPDKSVKTISRAKIVFNGNLHQLGSKAHISSCEKLLTAHLGSVEDVYVGNCRLTTGRRVVMCGDTGVGEFGLNLLFYGSSDADLVAFSKTNCPGG
jgi:hypothetical protein